MTGLEVQNSSRSFIDASRYPDMADLMEIADFFITDYSSSAGDFVLRNKPMILATFDRIEYQKNCREFKVPVEAPGDRPGMRHRRAELFQPRVQETGRC